MWGILITKILIVLSVVVLVNVSVGSADDGPGVPVSQYVSQNSDEASIIHLIRTVGEGWARKDVDHIMSAYGPDATQRAWNDPNVMIDYQGIRNEALGAFRDPKIGRVNLMTGFTGSISSIARPSWRSIRGFTAGVTTTTIGIFGCLRADKADGSWSATITSRSRRFLSGKNYVSTDTTDLRLTWSELFRLGF